VVAIGGIDVSNARSCIEAGAGGVAVVRASVEAERVRRQVDAAL
jgi:thiamine monophosphate synthase